LPRVQDLQLAARGLRDVAALQDETGGEQGAGTNVGELP
jgi:hypothetical protein